MLVDKALVDDNAVACHYCARGKRHETDITMVYPYAYVYVFKGEKGALTSAMCVSCIEELHGKVKDMEPKLKRSRKRKIVKQ